MSELNCHPQRQLCKRFDCPQGKDVCVCVCVFSMRVYVGVEQWAQGQMELKTHLCRGVICSQIKKTSIQCIRSGKNAVVQSGWMERGKQADFFFFCTSASTFQSIVTATASIYFILCNTHLYYCITLTNFISLYCAYRYIYEVTLISVPGSFFF